MAAKKKKKRKKKEPVPTGIAEIDDLATLPSCTIQDYIKGVSAYVKQGRTLDDGPKKAGQIRLSNALARALAGELEARLPRLKGKLITQERRVAGALRTTNADVSETHRLDGLRLAVELKPINLAVGRAIWNRFGDIRTFAVNLHLKFPFSVIGGVLVIPTYEETGTKAAKEAEKEEEVEADGVEIEEGDAESEGESPSAAARKSTVHLIERAVERLIRAGGRKNEADAPHLIESIAVVVYDPDTATIHPELPEPGSGLRWREFVDELAAAYRARFEE